MTDAERYERGQAIVREVEREFAGRPMQEMVEEVRARVEKLMVTDGGVYSQYLMKPVEAQPDLSSQVVSGEPLRAEPLPVQVPEKAFPDHFYYKLAEPRFIDPQVCFPEPSLQIWITPTENFGKRSHADWNRSEPPVPGLMCQCGHRFEEHAPACVHLIEGCGCEGFLKVPQGVVEGS